jgi:hypothetical protein
MHPMNTPDGPHGADAAPTPPEELPPVDPPSARFIMQLFVIPFLVVVALVCGLLVVYTLFGRIGSGTHDAVEYVRTIRSGNEHRRSRAAYDLASLIHNEPKLAEDPALLGEIAALLGEELNRPPGKARTEVMQFLALAIGAFHTLDARGPSGPVDPVATLTKALAPDQPPEVRAAAAQSLSRLAALTGGSLGTADVVPALVEATRAEAPEVRRAASYALGNFDVPEARAALARVVEDGDRFVRYDAAAALARLGDPAARPVIREMLSRPDLEAAFSGELKEAPDRTRAQIDAIQREALRSLEAGLDAGHAALAATVRADLERLAQDAPPDIRAEARNLLKKLPAGATPARPAASASVAR